MRKLFTVLLTLIIGFTGNAKTYYVSGSGNDNNNGLTTSTSWKTLARVSSFTTFTGGDAVLFNRGEVFYGQLIINNSGSSGNPITIGAYGSGADPVISGFTAVTAWTNLGNNIWESTNAVSTLSATNMVVINGVNTPMGRYPNTGYLTYQSFSGNTSITSSSLTGSTNWTGAEAIIRKQRWIIDRNPITAQSGSTLTYKSSSTYNGQSGYGFFIQNDSRTLDTTNEWYYNSSTKKLRIYSATAPTNVQMATEDTLVYMKYRNYITFDNLTIQGSNKDAFVILSSANITIQNCTIDYSGTDAIWGNQNWGKPSSSFVLQNSLINHTNNNAIYLASEFAGALISHNTFKNTGMIVGLGGSGDAMSSAVQTKADNAIIEYNEVDSVGYVGIGFYNNNTIVRNNFVNGFNFVKLDGAGIYTWVGTGNSPFTGEKVLNNIVMNGFGDNSGTTASGIPISHGMYMDDWTANVEISGNSISNCPYSGLYLHKAHDINVHNNTIYNNGLYQLYMVSSDAGSLIRNDIVKNNIFVSRTSSQTVGGFTSILNDIVSFGTIDSNYYARPMDDNIDLYSAINITGLVTYFHFTLAQWQVFSGFDTHSHKSPKTITTLNDLRFEYNATSSNKTVSLDGTYIDVKNVSYNGSITLAPYTSAVLIRNGAATNQPPVANAGSDQTITLPTNSVTLSGSGTDANGTISSYAWTKISGPTSGTITNPGSASTTVTSLVQGVYKFQLQVTDNNGASGLDTVQITVNSSGNIPPVANAGGDQTITTSSTTLNGSGTDQDGTIASYAWTEISGPAATIVSPGSASTLITGLVTGVYQFQLKVTDNNGATGIDVILVTVNPASNLLPAVNPGSVVNGLDYNYYESGAGWSVLPVFSTLTPVETGTSTTFDISLANRTTIFAFNFTGYINVPSDGQYTFYTNSDDGSNLYIDNVLVVNNDGLHGATEKSGTIGLQAGKHAISVGYFQQAGGSSLTVSYAGPGIAKQIIPASAVYRVSANGLLPAVNPANTVNGLDYDYYEAGTGWNVLPDFSTLTPTTTATSTTFDITLATSTTTFAFNFTGFINVPTDGQYTFYTSSDDGSNLYIDNVLVVNNDGLHGTTEQSGTIGLQAGKHAITVGYFQQAGGSSLTVSYAGPGITKQVIPASALYRISTDGLLPAVNPANAVNGLDYDYYESGKGWTVLPDFSTLTPVKTGTTTNFTTSVSNKAIAFALNFTGFVTVPTDGQYTFYTTSDDGSDLYIDNVLVVNNDGLHSAIEKSGIIGLQAGKHAISVVYFQQGGDSTLSVSYSGPGVSKQAIPSSALYRISTTGSRGVAMGTNNQIITSSSQIGVKAYPNPFASYIQVNITGGAAGQYELMLFDASGKIVWSKSGVKNAGDFQQSINTGALQRGTYFIKVIQNNISSIISVVK